MPDVAVRPWLRGAPLDGVVAVVDLVAERWNSPSDAPAAARVLDDDGVAALDGAQRVLRQPDHRRRALVVGRALQQDRMALRRCGPVDVGVEDGAVAHRHRDVPLDRDACAHRLTCRAALTATRAGPIAAAPHGVTVVNRSAGVRTAARWASTPDDSRSRSTFRRRATRAPRRRGRRTFGSDSVNSADAVEEGAWKGHSTAGATRRWDRRARAYDPQPMPGSDAVGARDGVPDPRSVLGRRLSCIRPSPDFLFSGIGATFAACTLAGRAEPTNP